MKTGRIDEAERSMRFYRNIKETDRPESESMLQNELDKLRAVCIHLDEKPGNTEKTEESNAVTWADFSKSGYNNNKKKTREDTFFFALLII